MAAVEMYKRQLSQQVERRQIRMSKDVYELMEPLIGDLPNEEFLGSVDKPRPDGLSRKYAYR